MAIRAYSIVALLALPAVLAQAAHAQDDPAPDAVKAQLQARHAQLVQCQDEINHLESTLSWSDRTAARLERMLPATPAGWFWFVLGFGGEFVFFLRFVVQWWASERKGRTVVPMAFWHLSLIGTGLVLAYALYRIDPVFILAYSLNVFIYVRNMTIAKRSPALEAVAEKTSE